LATQRQFPQSESQFSPSYAGLPPREITITARYSNDDGGGDDTNNNTNNEVDPAEAEATPMSGDSGGITPTHAILKSKSKERTATTGEDIEVESKVTSPNDPKVKRFTFDTMTTPTSRTKEDEEEEEDDARDAQDDLEVEGATTASASAKSKEKDTRDADIVDTCSPLMVGSAEKAGDPKAPTEIDTKETKSWDAKIDEVLSMDKEEGDPKAPADDTKDMKTREAKIDACSPLTASSVEKSEGSPTANDTNNMDDASVSLSVKEKVAVWERKLHEVPFDEAPILSPIWKHQNKDGAAESEPTTATAKDEAPSQEPKEQEDVPPTFVDSQPSTEETKFNACAATFVEQVQCAPVDTTVSNGGDEEGSTTPNLNFSLLDQEDDNVVAKAVVQEMISAPSVQEEDNMVVPELISAPSDEGKEASPRDEQPKEPKSDGKQQVTFSSEEPKVETEGIPTKDAEAGEFGMVEYDHGCDALCKFLSLRTGYSHES